MLMVPLAFFEVLKLPLTIWPVDDGRYGLDATFQGATGYERAARHEADLERRGVKYRFHQELDGGWTLRFGPLRAVDVAVALPGFKRSSQQCVVT